MKKKLYFFNFCLFLSISCLVQANVWQLKELATVKGQYILLSDLIMENQVEIPEIFHSVSITSAPRFGEQAIVSRAQILNAINRSLGITNAQKVSIPDRIKVIREGGILREAELQQTAIDALEKRWVSTCNGGMLFEAKTQTPTLIPEDENVFFSARVPPDVPYAPRVNIWVDIFERNKLYRSIPISLNVTCSRLVAKTKRKLRSGESIQADDLIWQKMNFFTLPEKKTPNEELLVNSELRRNINEGALILFQDIRPIQLVRKNQRVKLKVTQDQLELSIIAIALNDGALNDVVFVQSTFDRNQTLRARVLGTGYVEVIE